MSRGWIVVLVVLVALLVLAWLAWIDRGDRHPVQLEPDPAAPLPLYTRSWLVVDARVRHDVLGLGTVLDPTPSHAPYAGQVLVRFDTLSAPRWCRPSELDLVTPEYEDLLRKIEERRPRLQQVDGVERGVWARECAPGGASRLAQRCYRHTVQCGMPGFPFCCAACPARPRGGAQ